MIWEIKNGKAVAVLFMGESCGIVKKADSKKGFLCVFNVS